MLPGYNVAIENDIEPLFDLDSQKGQPKPTFHRWSETLGQYPTAMSHQHTIYIGCGGNLGDVPATMQQAIHLLTLARGWEFVGCSSQYRTAPMGTAAGETFLNGVLAFRTMAAPADVLARLQQTEADCGRVRHARWEARPLDLDLLYYGSQTVQTAELTVPHPHAWYRRFVLDPLCELAPDLVHPLYGWTIAELLAAMQPRPLPVIIEGSIPEELSLWKPELERRFPIKLLPDTGETRGEENESATGLLGLRIWAGESESAPLATGKKWSPWVSLRSFPTPPLESLIDILTAATTFPEKSLLTLNP